MTFEEIMEARVREITAWYAKHYSQKPEIPVEESHQATGTRKAKLMEFRAEQKGNIKVKYHIGSVLPEAKQAWSELNLKETVNLYMDSDNGKLTIQAGEKGKAYHVGSLLTEARQACANLMASKRS